MDEMREAVAKLEDYLVALLKKSQGDKLPNAA